jgi:Na+-driven multidrug efflux pump
MLAGSIDGGLMMPNTPLLSRQFLLFLGPLIVTNVLQALFGTVNSIYIGRMLGVGALAAVSGFIPVLLLLISFVIGLGAGASILVAQAWGAREPDRLRAVAGTALCAGVILGFSLALCGSFLADRLMGLLGTPPDVLAQAVLYAKATHPRNSID